MSVPEAAQQPTVLALPHDLLRVLDGHTLTVTDTEGREYSLRLFTAQEFLVAQHAAVDRTGADASLKINLDAARKLTGDRS